MARKRMQRWKRAWDYFNQAFRNNERIRVGYSKKQKRVPQADLYWSLIQILREMGITTYVTRDLGERRDASGKKFTVGGTWDNGRDRIDLTWRSFHILAHETAHAVHRRSGSWHTRASGELVACGAGYLLYCSQVNLCSPHADVAYAKQQGANIKTLDLMEDEILTVFHLMEELMQK